MTNMNPFDEDKIVDIPDFVEEKDKTDDVDMSIFKMSDEELYDDVPKKPKKQKVSKSSSRSNATLILSLALIVVLLITSCVAIIYGIKQSKSNTALTSELAQTKAKNVELQTTVNELNIQVGKLQEELNNIKDGDTQKDPNNKYPAGTVLYITEAGQGMGIKKTPSMDADFVDESILNWGDKIVLKADATKDSNGNYWAEIEKGFIRIEYNGEIWASTEEQ